MKISTISIDNKIYNNNFSIGTSNSSNEESSRDYQSFNNLRKETCTMSNEIQENLFESRRLNE